MTKDRQMAANTSGLKPFTKGVSGNPAGRSKGADRLAREAVSDGDLTAIMKLQIELALGRIPEGIKIKELSAKDITNAASFVTDRVCGKPRQTIDGDVSVGVSPEQAALLAALQMSPHERRARATQLDAANADEQADADAHIDADEPE